MTSQSDLLTVEERLIVFDLGQIYNRICAVVEDGPTRGHDLNEIAAQIHVLQKAIMGQAAARAYPEEFRLLGESGVADA